MLRATLLARRWNRMLHGRRSRVAATLLTFIGFASTAAAQVPGPSLQGVFPTGGKPGSQFEVTLNGAELEEATQLHFSVPGITAELQRNEANGAQPAPRTFLVNIPAEVETGLYEIRVVTPYGISNPRAFQISSLPDIRKKKPSNTRATANEVSANSVVNGIADPAGTDFYRFSATKGQRILIDCWAERLDSRLDATLVLYDANGNELDRSLDVFGRDPFLDFEVPADGQYVVALNDFLYRGGTDYAYRLSFSTAPFVDFIFPFAGEAGKKSKFTLYGRNLPGGVLEKSVVVRGRAMEKLEVEIELQSDPAARQRMPILGVLEPRDGFQDAFAYRLKTPQGDANPINIYYATGPVVLEQEPTNNDPDTAQSVTIPCEIVGQFHSKGDRDCFQFDAKKGEVLWIEVISQRMGLTTDPVLTVQRMKKDDKGTLSAMEFVEVDDFTLEREKNQPAGAFALSTDDPIHKLVVPDDGTYRLTVRDQYSGSRGSPLMAYRLSLRRATPDFRLLAISEGLTDEKNQGQLKIGSPIILKNGATHLRVVASRTDGFDGEIVLSVEGLPEGYRSPGATIGPKSHSASVIISMGENAAAWTGPLKIVGRAKISDQELTREARAAAILWNVTNPQNEAARARLTQMVMLGVNMQDESPASILLGESKPLEVKVGDKLSIPIKVTRRGDFKASLKFKAIGLPKEAGAAEIDIGPTAGEGSFVVDAKAGTPPGVYTFFVQATSPFNYRRNTKAADAAMDLQKKADKALTQAAATVKTTAEKAQKATQAVTDAENALRLATEQMQANVNNLAAADNEFKNTAEQLRAKAKALTDIDVALKNAQEMAAAGSKEAADSDAAMKLVADNLPIKDRELKESADALQAANERLKAATDSLAQNPDDQAMKDALAAAQSTQAAADTLQKQRTEAKQTAEKSLADEQARQKKTHDAKVAAEKALADAQNQQKQATAERLTAEQTHNRAIEKQKQLQAAKSASEATLSSAKAKRDESLAAKANAEKAAAEAVARQMAADAEKVAAAKRFKDATEAAKPKSVNINFVSTPVTVTISPSPKSP